LVDSFFLLKTKIVNLIYENIKMNTMKTKKTKGNRFLKTKRGVFITTILSVFLSTGACSKDEISIPQQNEQDNLTVPELQYAVVGTNQTTFYDDFDEISAPIAGQPFYGQDASYASSQPDYSDNGDGTITDNLTGMMWSQSADINKNGVIDYDDKLTHDEAVNGAKSFDLAGYTDWRLPSIKELYSLIVFSGRDVDPMSASGSTPFINTDYFGFAYGDINAGERIIDAQFATSTMDVGDSQFGGGNLMFGVNFADGRIKGYPTGAMPGQTTGKKFYVLYVRGNENYGQNAFVNNGDGTITDEATSLMWMQNDSGEGMNWKEALEYAENKEFAGYSDWRLPNIKELQSIVDYSRAPGATGSAAIDPLFSCTHILNEAGQPDFPYYWSGTTHASVRDGGSAAYVSFGRAMGYFNYEWQDVHGAGAQRSDPKTGEPGEYPYGHGPQGDAIRIYNLVRLVRNVE
jgi:hypothetical protein